MKYLWILISSLVGLLFAHPATAGTFSPTNGFVFDAAHQHPDDKVDVGLSNSVSMVSGGYIGSILTVFDSAAFTMNDGSVGSYIDVRDTATFIMNGGTAESYIRGDGGVLNIYGGSIPSYLEASGNSTVNVSGGSIDLLHRSFGGTLNIDGQNLVLGSHHISGTLADGTPLDAGYVEFFANGGSLNLISVPEPSSVSLIGLGSVGVLAARRLTMRRRF